MLRLQGLRPQHLRLNQKENPVTTYYTDKRASLKRFKSDLADTFKPEIISKYPHLAKEENREQLRATIKALAEDIAYDEAVARLRLHRSTDRR